MIVPRYYENLNVLHENTMPARAYYIPASKRMDNLANSPIRIYGIFSKMSFLMSNVFFIVPAPFAWCDPPQHF